MKNLKKVLALVLAVVMILGTIATASAVTYTDVKATDNYAEAIDILSNLKILDGFKVSDDKYEFRADGTLTRAQAAKIVAIVHNAATNGKIQSDIADLYANAQNPFVDCNGNWALPYINYCRITGLADGMTATTYEPKREVTGVQFLKLMLTTLGFDTSKEGYTGTGWDINVLRRANEIGLLDGMEKGFEAIKPLKRGEAAQILYNALAAYMVEYGQVIKPGKTLDIAFISNENVSQSGFSLFEKMGGKVVRDTDEFRRPGYTWSTKSGWSKFYMDKPVNSYTSSVSECDILKNDMGIAENKATKVVLNGYVKGDTTKGSVGNKYGEKEYGTALNYYAIDGFKLADTRKGNYYDSLLAAGITLNHDAARTCKATTFGCQGTLTQVFKTEDGWVITSIHTFLANVDKVNTNNRKTHAKGESTDISAWMLRWNNAEYPAGSAEYGDEFADIIYLPDSEMPTYNLSTTEYAVGTKLNITVSMKDAQDALTGNKTINYGSSKVVTHVAAESKTGKLTGASGVTYANTTSIDGTKYNDNCMFIYGQDLSKNRLHNGETFKFYFDTYGNVIGAEEVGADAKYLVIDRMWSETPNGKFAVKADLVLADETPTAVEAATIKFGPFADEKLVINSLTISTDDRFNTWAEKQLYSYTVEDGVYTLTYAGVFENWGGAGMIKGFYRHSAGEAYLDDINKTFAQYGIINISESTLFLCEDMAGKYASYTGYSKLPALSAQYLDYVDDNGDGYADVVYLGDVTYAADKIIGFVAKWAPFSWSGKYDLVTVYVNGEATVVNVPADYQGANTAMGLYEFEMATDKDGNVYADIVNAKQLHVDYQGVFSISADKSAIQIGAGDVRSIALTGKALYLVNADLTVEPLEAKDIDLFDSVIIYTDDAGKIVALYFLDF